MISRQDAIDEAMEMHQRAYSSMQNEMEKYEDWEDQIKIKAIYLEFSGQLLLSLLNKLPKSYLQNIRDNLIKQLFEVEYVDDD